MFDINKNIDVSLELNISYNTFSSLLQKDFNKHNQHFCTVFQWDKSLLMTTPITSTHVFIFKLAIWSMKQKLNRWVFISRLVMLCLLDKEFKFCSIDQIAVWKSTFALIIIFVPLIKLTIWKWTPWWCDCCSDYFRSCH